MRTVLDVADGASGGGHPGAECGDDKAVEQAADLSDSQRDRAAVAGVVPSTSFKPARSEDEKGSRSRRGNLPAEVRIDHVPDPSA